MGESFNAVQLLEPPFWFLEERVIFIPRQRRLEVNNKDLKVILFLEGTVDLVIDGRPIGWIKKGDALIAAAADFTAARYLRMNRRSAAERARSGS